MRVLPAQTAAIARRFPRYPERHTDEDHPALTDNGNAFTNGLFGPRRRAATGNQDHDRRTR